MGVQGYQKITYYHGVSNQVFYSLLCRLHFPEELVEDGREKASYDVDSGKLYLLHVPGPLSNQMLGTRLCMYVHCPTGEKAIGLGDFVTKNSSVLVVHAKGKLQYMYSTSGNTTLGCMCRWDDLNHRLNKMQRGLKLSRFSVYGLDWSYPVDCIGIVWSYDWK